MNKRLIQLGDVYILTLDHKTFASDTFTQLMPYWIGLGKTPDGEQFATVSTNLASMTATRLGLTIQKVNL